MFLNITHILWQSTGQSDFNLFLHYNSLGQIRFEGHFWKVNIGWFSQSTYCRLFRGLCGRQGLQ